MIIKTFGKLVKNAVGLIRLKAGVSARKNKRLGNKKLKKVWVSFNMTFLNILIWCVIVAFIIYKFLKWISKDKDKNKEFVVDCSEELLTKRKRGFTDKNGYKRDRLGFLIHRNLAYNHLYNYPDTHKLRFRDYVVHHKDKNKKNNDLANLQIMTTKEHNKEHGYIVK